MRESHLQHLVCPECQSGLELKEAAKRDESRIQEGVLRCSKSECRKEYPILSSIPRFVPVENYASGFGLEWNEHARTQYDSHSGCNISEKRFFEETGWPRDLKGEVIVEVGGGSGRFTEQAASTGATVLSLDYSYAVEANHASNGDKENVLIVQGDLYKMPFKHNAADRIYCFGVLQHTPEPKRSLCELPKYVKSGGSVVADNYIMPTGIRKLLATKYWFRPITKRMHPPTLYRLCEFYVKLMWPLTRHIHKLPKGAYINWRLLLADYRDEFDLSEAMQREWAILDIFDKLAPAYDFPQTRETIEAWFQEAGLKDLDVRPGYNGIQGRGVKP